MAETKKTKAPKLTLAEIRSSLQDIEKKRAEEGISDEEREVLEAASVTLREAERTAISDLQNGIIKEFSKETEDVKLQAGEIRDLVTRMGRLPKVLGKIDTVLKECARVLRLIARLTLALMIVWMAVSCSTVSKSQMSRIKALSIVSDSVSAAPSALFEKLAEVRLERGLMYAMSLDGVDNHVNEINSMVKGYVNDEKTVGRANAYVKVLDSYLSALKSLSSESRWSASGTKIRGIGRDVDSVLIAYNKLKWSNPIEPGLAKQVGRTSGYVSDEIAKRVQFRKMKTVIGTGDSIVAACCDSLVSLLKHKEIEELIVNEEVGLESNYRSYLNAASRRGIYPDIAVDRRYIALKETLSDVREIQKKCASTLTSLKNAHHKLLLEMDERKKIDEYSADLQKLADEAEALRKYLK